MPAVTGREAAPQRDLVARGSSEGRSIDGVISRRRLLGGAAALIVVTACTDDGNGGAQPTPTSSVDQTSVPTSATPGVDEADGGLTPADFDGLAICTLLPEQTAGPFGLDQQFDRRDISEGYPGRPMRLGLRVVDESCAAVQGAAVEVWHCDATGDYSAFADGGGGKDEGAGTTFLRGTQTADDDGIVEFLTIVPGWYPGRAVHVHVRVRVDDAVALTSQLYFEDSHLADVYASAPYSQFGAPDTSLAEDGIAGDAATNGTLLRTTVVETEAGPGTLALANLGIGGTR
jgi:protocatechuate 3,4-dioxygenase beta subunit